MRHESAGPCLSAVFVDYDNIYLSLRRKDEEAARRFAREAHVWLRAIESGRLITQAHGGARRDDRRIVLSRCYGNPVPRRNPRDNSTDMSSFPFIRHHFLRAGFEIIDCPPLTAQLKNSSDIRMVMDVRDLLSHETYFDEFIILSGDADFTPVLHRLRAHARRTMIYANEHTASPYTAICDGEIREQDLIKLLLESAPAEAIPAPKTPPALEHAPGLKAEILAPVLEVVRTSDRPVPLETLADRAQRAVGYEKTVGSGWAGHGSFRAFLAANLPDGVRISDQPPFLAIDASRHTPAIADRSAAQQVQPTRGETPRPDPAREPSRQEPARAEPSTRSAAPAQTAMVPAGDLAPARRQALGQQPIANLQQSIARIHEACQAPPLAPPEYRLLFESIAAEIAENHVSGGQTVANVIGRARQAGLDVKRDDVRFVLDVISEADPWFEQGTSASLFAGRFRNFVVARCRSQGLNLTADELDLIDAWFAGATPGTAARPPTPRSSAPAPSPYSEPAPRQRPVIEQRVASEREASYGYPTGAQLTGQDTAPPSSPGGQESGLMPRIVRSRVRG